MSAGLPREMKRRTHGTQVAHVTGVILLVQEHRFQLETEQGTRLNFMLRHDADLEWRDLLALEQSRRPVEVIFHPSLHLSARAVSEVRELPARAGRSEAASTYAIGESP